MGNRPRDAAARAILREIAKRRSRTWQTKVCLEADKRHSYFLEVRFSKDFCLPMLVRRSR